jgi:hypothetical protein
MVETASATLEAAATTIADELSLRRAEEVVRVMAASHAARATRVEASAAEDWAAAARRVAEEAKARGAEQPLAGPAAAAAGEAAARATRLGDQASEAAAMAERLAGRATAVLESYQTLVVCAVEAAASSPPHAGNVTAVVGLRVLRPALALEDARQHSDACAELAAALKMRAEASAATAEDEARNATCAAGAEELVWRVVSSVMAAKSREDARKRLRQFGKLSMFSVAMNKAADSAQAARDREAEIIELSQIKIAELMSAARALKNKEDVAVKAATAASLSAYVESLQASKGQREVESAVSAAHKPAGVVSAWTIGLSQRFDRWRTSAACCTGRTTRRAGPPASTERSSRQRPRLLT